jgi:hypothetical protein
VNISAAVGQELAKTSQGSRGRALDGARRASKQVGSLDLRHVLPVAKHENDSLSHGQRGKSLPELICLFHLSKANSRSRIGHHRERCLARIELGSAVLALYGAVNNEVDEDPPGVRIGVFHSGNATPSSSYPMQSLLDEILGFAQVPGHQVGAADQSMGVRFGERVEGPSSSRPVSKCHSCPRCRIPVLYVQHHESNFG